VRLLGQQHNNSHGRCTLAGNTQSDDSSSPRVVIKSANFAVTKGYVLKLSYAAELEYRQY